MGVKIFRNGRWEEVEYEDNLRTRHIGSDAPLFFETGEGFSVNGMGFSLRNDEHTLTGNIRIYASSTLKANSKYYIGRLFPQQIHYASIISYIYNCAICQYNDIGQTYLPAVIWTDSDKKSIWLVPLFTANVAAYTAGVEIDFIFNFNDKLNSDYINELFG